VLITPPPYRNHKRSHWKDNSMIATGATCHQQSSESRSSQRGPDLGCHSRSLPSISAFQRERFNIGSLPHTPINPVVLGVASLKSALTPSFTIPVKRIRRTQPKPVLVVPDDSEEIANFDSVTVEGRKLQDEYQESLYLTSDGRFLLVHSELGADDQIAEVTREAAARWYLATVTPKELRGVFAIVG